MFTPIENTTKENSLVVFVIFFSKVAEKTLCFYFFEWID